MAYCLYLRKSRKDYEAEAHGEGETLARHEKMLMALAKKNKFDVTKIYREIVSGETIAARPVVQQLLQDVEAGKWDGVLVAEVERLARGDTIDQGVMAQAFKYSNTLIITPLKTYDPTDEYDEEYFEFGLFMSRREYKTINRRLIRGRIASANEGKWVAGRAPYGYERVRVSGGKGWTLRPIESEAEIVRFIFQLYTSGEVDENGNIQRVGTYVIGKRLYNMGVVPPSGSDFWYDHTIREILKNPTYIGKIRYGFHRRKKKIVNNEVDVKHYTVSPDDESLVYVDGLHPAIVDKTVFQQAQDLLKRSGPPPVPGGRRISNPLAGILVCGLCGHKISLHNSKGYYTLRCINRNCKNHGARFDIVEERLLQALESWLSGYRLQWSDDLPPEEKSVVEAKQSSLRRLDGELNTLRKQLSRSYDLLEQGVYDTDTFLERSKILSESISEKESNMAALSVELREAEEREANRINIVPKVQKLLEVYRELPSAQAKNDMLKEVLEKVEYTRSGEIHRSALDDFELVIYPKLPPVEE